MRRAVVLFNLGGPDGPEAVRPFLESLLTDPAILRMPGPLRRLLGRWIAKRRAPVAQESYALMGGSSPLLAETMRQAEALAGELAGDAGTETKVFVCMRHWRPRADETAREVKAFAPDELVLLPLYPQNSTTTTGSALDDWRSAARAAGIDCPERAVCCHFRDEGFVAAHAALVRETAEGVEGPFRILFSAHGLPEKIVREGDPYEFQVKETVAAVVRELGGDIGEHAICYQSRVGRLIPWLGPSTLDEVARAGRDGVAVVLVPIAFVSEHVETLVELDIEVRDEAERAGVPLYRRVPAIGCHPLYVRALAGLVRGAATGTNPPGGGPRLCPREARDCPCP